MTTDFSQGYYLDLALDFKQNANCVNQQGQTRRSVIPVTQACSCLDTTVEFYRVLWFKNGGTLLL